MVRHGTRPTRKCHLDIDFLASHKLGGVTATEAQFADTFLADAGKTMPDQETIDYDFYPPVPAMPFGCTDEAQADIATDLTGTLHNPADLDAVTHANASGGYDIRSSLNAAIGLGWFKEYFNITVSGSVDAFDTFRLAQTIGVSAGEKRSITFGTPWFQSWEQAALAGQIIMPMPTAAELASLATLPWHNSVLDGWLTVNGQLVYRDKSWQGPQIGDKGFLYFPREVINAIMAISGTAAFTPSNTPLVNPITVTLSTWEWIVSVLRNILGV